MYWISGSNYNKDSDDIRHYICDYESDVNKLPTTTRNGFKQGEDTVSNKICGAGSICFCIENGGKYILGKETGWKRINTQSSSGGGSSYDDPLSWDEI